MMPNDPMTLSKQLTELAGKATPGPWEEEYDPIEDDEHPTAICLPGYAGQFGTFIAHCSHNWNDAVSGERRISWKEAESNAALIVALRNNLPTIIQALEAQEWRGIESAPNSPSAASPFRRRHEMITDEQEMALWRKACGFYEDAGNSGDTLREKVIAGDEAAATYLKSRINEMLAEKDAEIERLRVVLDCHLTSCHLHGKCMYSPCCCPRAALKETQP